MPPACLNVVVMICLYNINRLVFITETDCVYCAVRTGYLNMIEVILISVKHQRHVTDLCEVLLSPARTLPAVCSRVVRWDRSTFWISVWLPAPAVPVASQLQLTRRRVGRTYCLHPAGDNQC